MPSSVADILAAAGAHPAGVVRWGTPPRPPDRPDVPATGVYVVALTDEPDSLAAARARFPVSGDAIDRLLAVRSEELRLDGALQPTREALTSRLAAFWLPDEVVLYIGLAGPRKARPPSGELAKRVSDYYRTPLGARAPHAGGWPLKVLSCLAHLHVHYAYCADVDLAEAACIARFSEQVSQASRASLHDPDRVMPFANLEFPKGNAKRHGIRGARAPKAGSRSADPPSASAMRSEGRLLQPVPAFECVHRTQNVTENDIRAGQVRIPIGQTKRLLPLDRRDITVMLGGLELACRWDPSYGRKERSGVIRVGRSAAARFLTPGQVLAVTVREGVVHLE